MPPKVPVGQVNVQKIFSALKYGVIVEKLNFFNSFAVVLAAAEIVDSHVGMPSGEDLVEK